MLSDPDFDQQLFQELERLVVPMAPHYERNSDLAEKFREAVRGIELRDRPRTSQSLEAIAQQQKKLSKEHHAALEVARCLLSLPPEADGEPFDHVGYLTELKATKARLDNEKVLTKDNVRYLVGFGLGSVLIPVGLVVQEPRLTVAGIICSLGFAFYIYFFVSLRQMNRQGLHMTNTEIALLEERLARSEKTDSATPS